MIRMHKLAIMALALTLLVAPVAKAQEAAPSRVAVINTTTIFMQMKETADLRDKAKAEAEKFQATATEKQKQIVTLRSARDELKEGSAQWNERNLQLLQESINLDNWQRYETARLQQQEKQQTRALFDKIVAAVGAVAKQRNIDIVYTHQTSPLPASLDQITIDQIRAVVTNIPLIYADPRVDITDAVLAKLDADYSAGAAPAKPN